MKNIFFTATILFISGSILLSCSKSSTTSSTPVYITGYWFGTYNSSASSGNAGTAFSADGRTVVYNFGTTGLTDTAICPLKYVGTCTVNGNSVNFIVTTPSLTTLNYKATANVSAAPNTIAGTFTSTGGLSGNFSVTKQ